MNYNDPLRAGQEQLRRSQEQLRRSQEQAEQGFRRQQEQWSRQAQRWRDEEWERYQRQRRKPPTTTLGKVGRALEFLISVIILLAILQFVLGLG